MSPKTHYLVAKIQEISGQQSKQILMVVSETFQKSKVLFDALISSVTSVPVDQRNLVVELGVTKVFFHDKNNLNCFTYQSVLVDEWENMTDEDWSRILRRVRPAQ